MDGEDAPSHVMVPALGGIRGGHETAVHMGGSPVQDPPAWQVRMASPLTSTVGRVQVDVATDPGYPKLENEMVPPAGDCNKVQA